MRGYRWYFIILLLFFGVTVSNAYGGSKENLKPQIPTEVQQKLDAHIKKQKGADRCATEYKKARRFYWGDLNRDSKQDIAALYTIEGFNCGNNYYFYLAVFVNQNGKFILIASTEVGGKSKRFVDFNSIKDGKIILDTKEYLPGDPTCCPSGKGQAEYILKDNQILPVKEDIKQHKGGK